MGNLIINPVYNASVTNLNVQGNAAYNPTVYIGYTTAVNIAINYFQTTFKTLGTGNVTLNIGFGWGDSDPGSGTLGQPGYVAPTVVASGGATSFITNTLSYTTLRGLLTTDYTVANGASALQISSLAVLPATDPTNGTGSFQMNPGEQALLDPTFLASLGTGLIGYSGLAIGNYIWNQSTTGFTANPDFSDAVSTDEHEISELLGRGMFGGINNQYSLEDFFAYQAAGNPTIPNAFGAAAGAQNLPGPGYSTTVQTYFSPDGKTVYLPFRSPGDPQGNDLADWGSGGTGGNLGAFAPQATLTNNGTTLTGGDSYDGAGSGVSPLSTTDAQVMSVIAGLVIQCFATGTRIATTRGEVAVEDLAEGDLAVTARGRTAPIQWIGHRWVDCTRHPRPRDVLPIRVAAGAFGSGRPRRDLVLSPDHAVYIEDVLIPIRHLVNGATIRQEAAEAIVYWHVELPKHDLLLAEGLPAESYLDTGNRGAFANGGCVVHQHPDFSPAIWEAASCAKLVAAGPELSAARRTLLARAGAMGFRTTHDAGGVRHAAGSR